MPDLPTGTVTFLFTDIEGSTTRWEHHPEAMRTALARHDALLRSVITSQGGSVFKMVGDAVYAAFALPADAVSAALTAQRALAAEEWGEVGPLRVRMALHTGAAQSRDDDYFGQTLNRVARVLSTGYGGQILLSVATVELVRDALPAGASLKDLGEHALKDLLRPEHIFQLTGPDLLADFPGLKSLERHPHNLPVQPTPFLGREQEVTSVCALLSRPEVHLVTLTGPGGIGKTRLSLQVAAELSEQFADGVFFVALAPVSDAELVMPTITQTMGFRETEGQSPLALLKAALKDKQMLLLLDNFEQVIEGAVQVAELLATCPKLKLIVTSRVVLHVQAEREFAVPPLSLPDPKHLPDLVTLSQYEAVALFIERAQAVKPDFQVTNANAPAVAGICARLDGLPLAIELAAARVKFFAPKALLARLEQGLAMLTGGARDLPARQQTLRGAIAWSYNLLPPQEQQLFRRLSVFVDGCMWEAAEVVCRAAGELEGDVLDGLLSLVDKSLLRQQESAEGEPRFWMLQTLREFGLEVLAFAGETELTRQAHVEYYLRMVEQAEAQLRGAEQARWLARLEQEHENLRAALEWALEDVADEQMPERRDIALRLSAALWHFWEMHGHFSEARTELSRALARSEGASVSLRVKVLQAGASVMLQQGDYARAEELVKLSLALYRELGNTRGIADCLGLLVELAWRRGKMAEATTLSEEQVRLMRQVGEPGEVADALYSLAEVVSRRGDLAKGEALYQEAWMLYRKAGNDLGVAATLIISASELWWLSLADAATIQTIRHRLQEGQTIVTKLGSRHWIGFCSWLGVLVALSEGETARAESLAQEHLAIFREIGNRYRVAWALHILGRVEAQRGDLTAARSWYQQSLALTLELGDKFVTPFNLEGLAGVLLAQGELIWAAHLWGAAEALREATGVPLRPGDRAGYEQAVATARAHLGEQAFATAWAEGRAMPLEQAIHDVLKLDGGAGTQ